MLHELMVQYREEILQRCAKRLRGQNEEEAPGPLMALLARFIEEIERVLANDEGGLENSPLPEQSGSAAHAGEMQFLHGYSPWEVVTQFGMVCDAVFAVALERGVLVTAREAQLMNRCIDTGAAEAIRQYWGETVRAAEHEELKHLGALAHELRDALSSATMGFDLIRAGSAPVGGRTAEVVARSLRRMRDLIRQSVAEVRLRSGLQPRRQRIRLRPLLESIAESAVVTRGIRMAVEADDIDVTADEQLVWSAVRNLVQNALKFTRNRGRVMVRGRLERGVILIEVEDECGGLPPGKVEEMFQPFVQNADYRSGLGLGLSITRQAIEAQGGRVTVRDLPGVGCVFAVELPASIEEVGGSD
jgi:signal transduction histidine kinase